MERFPVELIYLLLFLGYIAFTYFTHQAAQRRRREEQERAGEAAVEEPPPFEAELPEYDWGRAPAPKPVPVSVPVARLAAPAPVAPPAARRLHPVRALLKDKRDLRRAVILTMVLGPCRAQEPPEQR